MISVLYDAEAWDPHGNITIKWEVIRWTPDGYRAIVHLFNFQQYRHIEAPGWKLGWTWTKNEVIWNMLGAEAVEQGDCSMYIGDNVPHSCKKDPTVVDLLPGTPYNQQISNCCRGGLIASSIQDSAAAVSSFELTVGGAGTSRAAVRIPKNFTLLTPAPGYICGPTRVVSPSKSLKPDGRRFTQALMTWSVTCTFSQFLGLGAPSCCVSLSAFYSDNIIPCTLHCPVRVHWHVKQSYKAYWRVKLTLTNLEYNVNYSHWNLMVEHPNFSNLANVINFNYHSITPYGTMNDTAMMWGVKFYNDVLLQHRPDGYVQSELLFEKSSDFTFHAGWAFPRRIYFNGDECVMPPPDIYPRLPSTGTVVTSQLRTSTFILLPIVYFFLHI